MKNIFFYLFLVLITTPIANCQCTNQANQWPLGIVDIIPQRTGQQIISTNNWPQNDYSVIEGLVVGETYVIDTNMATPFYITVTEDDANTIITHGEESVTFIATTTSIYCFWTSDATCTNGPNIDTQTRIECTSCICNDSSPNAVINPTPMNNQSNVSILYSNSNLYLMFDWEDDLSGGSDAPTGYTLYFDNLPNPNVRTNLFTGSELLIELPELQHNTQYYWRIESHNCAESILSPIWTFTTGSCSGIGPDQVNSINEPLDLATNVNIDETDTSNLKVFFDWNASTTGELATSYVLSLGTNPEADNIGIVNSFETFYEYTYNWAYDTTYYWFIRAQDCSPFDSTPSPIFSFTTESDPTLSSSYFELSNIDIYPNPTNNFIKINTPPSVILENLILIDTNGRIVNVTKEERLSNLNELSEGIYFLKINTNKGTSTKKIVIKNNSSH